MLHVNKRSRSSNDILSGHICNVIKRRYSSNDTVVANPIDNTRRCCKPGNRVKSDNIDLQKISDLLFYNPLVFTHTNTFLSFEQRLKHLKICKQLRQCFFQHTRSICPTDAYRKFDDQALDFFLSNCKSLVNIILTRCQKIHNFPARNENNIHEKLASVELASTCISLHSLESYFDDVKYHPEKYRNLKTIDIRGTPALNSFCMKYLNMNITIGQFYHAINSLVDLRQFATYIELNINNFQNNNYKNINNNKKEDLDCINNLNKILLLSLCHNNKSNIDNNETIVIDDNKKGSKNTVANPFVGVSSLSIAMMLNVPVRTTGGSIHHPEKQLILTTAFANSYVPKKVLQILLNNGADVNFIAGDGNYYSALMSACQNGASSSKLKLLLNYGADILFPCHNAENSLHFAISACKGSSKKRVTKILLSFLLQDVAGNEWLEYNRINRREKFTGWTYIMRAAYENSLGGIEALLQFNASCDVKDYADRTILHLASESNNPQILNVLVKKCEVDYNSSTCGTPLHVACRNLNIINVRILLNHGADVNIKFNDLTPATELKTKVQGYLTNGTIKRQILDLLDNYEPPITSISPLRKKRIGGGRRSGTTSHD